MDIRKYTVLSLFSGGMGLDLGLERTGRFRLRGCVEKVPAFCQTIRLNRDAGRLGNTELKLYEDDLGKLDPMRVMNDLGTPPGALDVIIGGPPCQAFSVFGRRRGLADERGQLILDFARFVDAFQPKVFLMENVRGLLSLPRKEGDKKGSLFEMVQARFKTIGYRTDCFVVNAANYGAPQIRERMFLIGNRHNLEAQFPPPTHSDRAADRLKPFTTLGDAIRGKRDPDPTIMDFSARKKRYLAMVPAGGNWRSLPVEIQKESMGKTWYLKGGRSAYWRKLSYEFPSPTIVTMPNHAGTSLCHPEELRPLSVGECARVQGFPDDWVFVGTPAEKYQQVGNAVPVLLAEVAAQAVAELADRIHTLREPAPGTLRPCKVIHLRPHVRTRWWWKDGEVINAIPYSERPKRRNHGGRTLFDHLEEP
jgi:DNA (cytosine-5)-methyltransferase 1